MTSFDAYDLIALWERDRSGLPVAEKALILLALARPQAEREVLGAMPIGERDRTLLEMRRDLFGQELEALSSCTECQEELEVTLHIDDLLADAKPSAPEAHASIAVDDIALRFRLPTTDDALAIAQASDGEDARRALVHRCILSAARDGEQVAIDELDDTIIERVSQTMETLDPISELRLNLTCAECDSPQSVLLEIGSYLWTELVSEAERLLEDVLLLARQYGWREADILAMSGRRRQFYLDRRTG